MVYTICEDNKSLYRINQLEQKHYQYKQLQKQKLCDIELQNRIDLHNDNIRDLNKCVCGKCKRKQYLAHKSSALKKIHYELKLPRIDRMRNAQVNSVIGSNTHSTMHFLLEVATKKDYKIRSKTSRSMEVVKKENFTENFSMAK